jgi:secernin
MRSRQLLAQEQGQITPQWMKRIARDHYEDSFLQGPYFDAADPDFHSICMHSSSAHFTWGNTASSCIAVLPRSTDEVPIFWWTPGPPCNGCYVPFFVHGSAIPEMVSRAGSFGKQVVPANMAREDSFAEDSYWWLFRDLMDRVKGDPIASLPGFYSSRNRAVRATFDALETEFEAEISGVMQRAMTTEDTGTSAAILDDFTHRCVERVRAALGELLAAFAADKLMIPLR